MESMSEQKEYIVRVEGFPYSFGLGEIVAPGCAYFAKGFYNLSKQELNAALKKVGKVRLR
jgi:hypothetical protein